MNTSRSEQREHFMSLLKRFDTVMLVTLNSAHEFHGRPMALVDVDDEDRLWFITGTETVKVHEIESDSHAYVTAQDGDSAFLTLSGRASIVDDHRKLEVLWKDVLNEWFPMGKEDPYVELICMNPQRGEYWDSTSGNRVRYFWQAAKAFAYGSTLEAEDEDLHGEVMF